jgi:hypothetical protein
MSSNHTQIHPFQIVDINDSCRFTCPICHHVIRGCAQIICGHIACKTCLLSRVGYFCCASKINKRGITENLYIQRWIDQSATYCIYRISEESGCTAILSCTTVASHQLHCAYNDRNHLDLEHPTTIVSSNGPESSSSITVTFPPYPLENLEAEFCLTSSFFTTWIKSLIGPLKVLQSIELLLATLYSCQEGVYTSIETLATLSKTISPSTYFNFQQQHASWIVDTYEIEKRYFVFFTEHLVSLRLRTQLNQQLQSHDLRISMVIRHIKTHI